MTIASRAPSLLRSVVAGLAGGMAWIGGLMLFFGPAQAILANPRYQSEKFLSVFGQMDPLPRTAEAPWILYAGLLVIGVIFGVAYRWVRSGDADWPWWRRGLKFGLVAWALMVPWFEFYLPWNVMHEPFALVMLEAVLWLAVLLGVGLAIASVSEWRLRPGGAPVSGETGA